MRTHINTGSSWRSLDDGTEQPLHDPGGGMFVGMYNLPEGEPQWLATEAEWGGIRSGIARSYSSGLPSTAPPSLQRDYGKRASWHSVKANWPQMAAGEHDATVTSFLNSIPADHELLLTFAHEPENDNPLNQEAERSAEWRAASIHFYDLVKSVRPQTWVGPVMMDWTYNPASGRVWERWTLPADKQDFSGLDPYQPYLFPIIGAPTTWHDYPMSAVSTWQSVCNDLGVPGAIGEIACHEFPGNPGRKAGWIEDSIQHSLDNNHLAYCYFNAYKPGDTAEPMLLNSHAQSLSTWAGVLSANQRGVKT